MTEQQKDDGWAKLITWDYLQDRKRSPHEHDTVIDMVKFARDNYDPKVRIDIVMVKDGPIREGQLTTFTRDESHFIASVEHMQKPAYQKLLTDKLRAGYHFLDAERVYPREHERP